MDVWLQLSQPNLMGWWQAVLLKLVISLLCLKQRICCFLCNSFTIELSTFIMSRTVYRRNMSKWAWSSVGFASLNCWHIRFFQQNHFISFLSETAGVFSHQHFDVYAKCAVSCQHDPLQCLNGCWEIQVSLAQGWHGNSSSKILSQFVCPSKKTQVINSWFFFEMFKLEPQIIVEHLVQI